MTGHYMYAVRPFVFSIFYAVLPEGGPFQGADEFWTPSAVSRLYTVCMYKPHLRWYCLRNRAREYVYVVLETCLIFHLRVLIEDFYIEGILSVIAYRFS